VADEVDGEASAGEEGVRLSCGFRGWWVLRKKESLILDTTVCSLVLT
jgi:hypothetical protein